MWHLPICIFQNSRPSRTLPSGLHANAWLNSGDRDFLTERLATLQEEYADLEFVLRPGVIHGDAGIGNVLHDSDGKPVVIDLDGFAIGPREWDLALTAIYYDSFGWHTRRGV